MPTIKEGIRDDGVTLGRRDSPPSPGLVQHLLPNTYLVVKTATSGLEEDDIVVRITHLHVEGGQVVASAARLLDWSRHLEPYELAELARRLEESKPFHGLTLADLSSRGEDALGVLADCLALIRGLPPGVPVVGHAAYAFDLPLLQAHFEYWLQANDFDFRRLPVYDVGLIEKALVDGDHIWAAQTVEEFHRRMLGSQSAARWSLAECLRRYAGQGLLPVPVPEGDPLYAAWASHAVYQAHRQLPSSPLRPLG